MIKCVPGEDANLLRAVLDRLPGMLRPCGLAAAYTIDVPDNSYTVNVHAEGLGFDESWMRLQHYEDLRAVCMLESRMPRVVE